MEKQKWRYENCQQIGLYVSHVKRFLILFQNYFQLIDRDLFFTDLPQEKNKIFNFLNMESYPKKCRSDLHLKKIKS